MIEENTIDKSKSKIYREEIKADDWSDVYKIETEVNCLPFGCYWNSPLPAAE